MPFQVQVVDESTGVNADESMEITLVPSPNELGAAGAADIETTAGLSEGTEGPKSDCAASGETEAARTIPRDEPRIRRDTCTRALLSGSDGSAEAAATIH